MNHPRVSSPIAVFADTHVIPTYWPVPGLGVIPMNAFLVRADEPVLVDTGVAILGDHFLDALAGLIDPVTIRWIWLTHEDRDHTGSLTRLLEIAPHATVLGTFMSFGRAAPDGPLPSQRTRIVNPGDLIDVGDRVLHAVRPPIFDSPGTLGFLDRSTGAYFSSDCFGAPLSADTAAAADTDHLDPAVLRAAQINWATVDSPWVTFADRDALRASVEAVRRFEPSALLPSHLPPVRRGIDRSLDSILAAREAEPASAVTQEQLEALLVDFAPGAPDPLAETPST